MSKKSADFGKWLTRKFLDIQSESGRQWTITEFAEFLNSPQQSVSRWLAGDSMPEEARVDKLASILGDEIYETAKLPKPSVSRRILDKFMSNWNGLTPEDRAEAEAFFSTITAEELIEFIQVAIDVRRKRRGKRDGGGNSEVGELSPESRGESGRKKSSQRLSGERI